MRFDRVIPLAAVLILAGPVRPAHATLITFDSAITPLSVGSPVLDSPGVLVYPVVPPSGNAFATQNFVFGGFTIGVTPTNTTPDPSIVDSSVCPVGFCTNGHFLAMSDPLAMNSSLPNTLMSISNLLATQVPAEADTDIPTATLLRVVGFRFGAIVADETFPLAVGFQTINLTDPDWSLVGRVIFQPLTANGSSGIVLIDNINATAVPTPEPASMVLLGTGVAGLIARRQARRRL